MYYCIPPNKRSFRGPDGDKICAWELAPVASRGLPFPLAASRGLPWPPVSSRGLPRALP